MKVVGYIRVSTEKQASEGISLEAQEAKIKAEEIIKKAKGETELIKKEADQYAIDSLDHLEIELSKILSQVRNGIATLKENQAENMPQPTGTSSTNSSTY